MRAVLADTVMQSQEVQPHSSAVIGNIAGQVAEKVFQYRLTKGRHYALTIYYQGSPVTDEAGKPACSFYDLTLSISRETQVMLATQCPVKDDTQTVAEGLPKRITDRDLDRDGTYTFDKMLKVDDVGGAGARSRVYAHAVSLELSENFDVEASVDFSIDQAMYSMQLDVLATDEQAQGKSPVRGHARLQQPLAFK